MASLVREVEVRKFDRSVTMNIHVYLTREFKIRKWIAINLIKAACSILGCGLKIEDENG